MQVNPPVGVRGFPDVDHGYARTVPEPDRNVSVADPAVVKRAVGAAAVGNITEWYDFGVYGYLTTTISKVFFTDLSGPIATIATFGLFAVSFLIRPFGGLLFGPLSDGIGRKHVLSLIVTTAGALQRERRRTRGDGVTTPATSRITAAKQRLPGRKSLTAAHRR